MKKVMIVAVVIIASTAITAGIVRAATSHNVTTALGGVSGDYFVVDGVMTVNSLKVGSQTAGGVTAFNGTILNNTTGTGGADNPITFGDNVRIDGRVYRGATAGAGLDDNKPFIVNDDMEVVGDLTVNGAAVAKKKVYQGTLDMDADGDEVVSVDQNPECPFDDYTATYDYHWAKIAVPELDMSDMPEINVYAYEENAASGWPNDGEAWEFLGGGHYPNYVKFIDGYVYINYKLVDNVCDGTVRTTDQIDGPYKIVVVY